VRENRVGGKVGAEKGLVGGLRVVSGRMGGSRFVWMKNGWVNGSVGEKFGL
jgi:hypothetical protein